MKNLFLAVALFIFTQQAWCDGLKVGDPAPVFKLKTDEGKDFDLSSRKGFWTVLYFYPKAETPGCTKQACAFRDSIEVIRTLGAEVYGISSDEVDSLKKFKEHHKLNFVLLADPDMGVIKRYGAKVLALPISKRWTFIIDPDLKIKAIIKNVDPVVDSEKMAGMIAQLKNQ